MKRNSGVDRFADYQSDGYNRSMRLEIKAVYENGMFRPLDVVSLDDHVTVSLTIRPSQEKEVPSVPNTDTDFKSQLENLLFDGPSLPENFRADIYADHD